MQLLFFLLFCGGLFSSEDPKLPSSFSLDSLDFADGSWRRCDPFQTFKELVEPLDGVDSETIRILGQKEDQFMQKIDVQQTKLEKDLELTDIGVLENFMQKLRVYIRYNLFFAVALNRLSDDVFIESIIQNFEKLEDVTGKRFLNLRNVIDERFKQIVLLATIFQNDFPFVFDEIFAGTVRNEIDNAEKTMNFTIFSGVILGRSLLHHLLFCKTLPERVGQWVISLTNRAKKIETSQILLIAVKEYQLTPEISHIQLLHFKIIQPGVLLPSNRSLNSMESLLKPLFDICFAICKNHGASKKSLLQLPKKG